MAAPKGNRFWEARVKSGRDKIFADSDSLWKASVQYFKWVMDNPLWENKATQYQGVPVDVPVEKLRPMTIGSLCLFLDIGVQTLDDYAAREDFSGIVARIKAVIYEQKFAGAAADLFNANIIARELGLKDASSREISGTLGVEAYELSETERSARIAALLNGARSRRDGEADNDECTSVDPAGGAAE